MITHYLKLVCAYRRKCQEVRILSQMRGEGIRTVNSASSLYALAYIRYFLSRAEAVRFELTMGCPMPPFQGGALDRYATPPMRRKYNIKAEGRHFRECRPENHLIL